MFAGFKNLKTHPKIKKTANAIGGQQPHRIPRKPRDRNKIIHQKTIIRLISIYKRLLFASIPFI
jgi:hypothetical protein